MEEKERYVIRYDLDYNQCLIDTEENQGVGDYIQIVKLLNQQDKRIKELEKENLSLQEQSIRDNQNWVEETTKLKQQLHDLSKKIVCEISEAIERLSWRKRIYTNWEFDKEQLYKDLDTILKKYGGEDE